jgi:hypothetical protein
MKKEDNKKSAVPKENRQWQGVDKDPRSEVGKGEPVTKNDLKGKTVDRVISNKGKINS